MTQSPTKPTVAIAGGGLAGLAAACALASSGLRVTVFERRPYLGGRASSYEHPGTGEIVDNCQHVLFRVCTNLVEFYQRIGVDQHIRWYDEMTFIEPGGRTSVMHASPLPAPLHTVPSFLRFPFLDATDKLAIARAMVPLTLTTPQDTGQSFAEWLQRHGQTQRAIDRFWKPILVSALSEDLELISIPYAAQVVRESMKTPSARHMGVPTIPLTDLYNAAGEYIQARGGELQFRSPVSTFQAEPSQVRLQLADREQVFDYLVLALPFDGLDRVLPEAPESTRLREMLSHFESAPITGIHLWFDRHISDLDHAVLLDRTIQWMFHKSRLQPMRVERMSSEPAAERRQNAAHGASRGSEDKHDSAPEGRKNGLATDALAPQKIGSYVELVVSASKSLIEKSRSDIVDLALRELREFFPAARDANLVKSTVIKEVHATYSPRPGIDAYRSSQITAWPRVFLAGDWTDTGWPATMEGAVRSGYYAAEALTRAAGLIPGEFLVPDLPATGLMRLFARG
ncbi:MAG: hydroxysqualene dehydroxylase HpnE [Acidobacteriia bacterium]|nr:hydroxysqualene dehydroxylase HpnE [Terriglobia bacterium]